MRSGIHRCRRRDKRGTYGKRDVISIHASLKRENRSGKSRKLSRTLWYPVVTAGKTVFVFLLLLRSHRSTVRVFCTRRYTAFGSVIFRVFFRSTLCSSPFLPRLQSYSFAKFQSYIQGKGVRSADVSRAHDPHGDRSRVVVHASVHRR